MSRYLPGPRVWLPLLGLSLLAAIFAYSVQADSTITIPVPEEAAKSKKVTLSLRIPPKTEPLTVEEKPVKMASKRSLIIWNDKPLPRLSPQDEFRTIMKKFQDKGWVKLFTTREVLATKNLDKYMAVRVLQQVCDHVLEILQAPDVSRLVRKVNLTASDIEDLRRMVQRFQTELIMFGSNPNRVDKDLLQLQERIKNARQGILKVIKVEGVEDGGTVIHLGVD
ncbi:MAG: hypothetical protein OZSIB_4282 [Candidatus Ozemobacter sibiricus]|jgi:hypothetical protein|uniref:Uncharacterized protein n=1 Tax=Candidatus Ozemobacter sibiricus TaxID=2268124 RepID=A0A367ZN21_9BACT|nr:MAG: hypothetical protein OZSIB_4282 [Candidatus Ozemobacter sibiricus]